MNDYNLNYGATSPYEYQTRMREAQKNEKKALYKNASKLGALLIIYNILNYLFLNAFYLASYSWFKKGFTFDVNTAKKYLVNEQADVIKGSSFSMTANLFVIALSAITLMLLAIFVFKIDIPSMLKPYKGCVKQGVEWAPLCITFNMLVGIIVAIFVQIMSSSGITVPEADFTITSKSNYAVIIQLTYVCIIGPVIEELIYRGMILKLLMPYGKGIAVFFSAFIFGLMHENIPQAASAFAGSIVYAMLAVHFGSILPTIAIHIINNSVASITDIGDAMNIANAGTLSTAIIIAMLFMGFYALIVKLKPLSGDIRSEEPACALEKNRRIVVIFTNIFMIIYFLYIIWQYIAGFISANS